MCRDIPTGKARSGHAACLERPVSECEANASQFRSPSDSDLQMQAIHPLPFWTTIQTAVFLVTPRSCRFFYFIKPRKVESPRASVSSFAANDKRKCVSRVEKTLPGITSTLCSIARSTNWVAVMPSAGGTSTNA